MCFLIQKHVFIHFLNNQNLLIQLNQIDVVLSKSLAKHIYSLNLLITVLKNVENLKGKQHEGIIISINIVTSVNLNVEGARHFVRISECLKNMRILTIQ